MEKLTEGPNFHKIPNPILEVFLVFFPSLLKKTISKLTLFSFQATASATAPTTATAASTRTSARRIRIAGTGCE